MDPVHRFDRPTLKSPRAVLAFEGWSDACEAASGAAAYLTGDTNPFALIDSEEFFDFQARRPTIEIVAGGTRRLVWPFTRFFAVDTGGTYDLITVMGEEPNLRWKTYTRHVTQVLADNDVDLVVTLGAFIGQVTHAAPVPIFGVATDPRMLDTFGIESSHYEGPTGITGVMLEACREMGIPALSLWAATPHYLAANPNPAAMLALLETAAPILDSGIDVSELEQVAAEFTAQVEEALEENDELAAYVRRLQEADPTAMPLNPGESERLITEIEHFLRSRER
ncbi:PAC2 family protein [bacterium]|nr:PAC2 family protein [bacterium]